MHGKRWRQGVGGVVFAALLHAGVVPTPAQAAESTIEDVTARLVALYAETGPVSAAQLRERVGAGVPPGALLALLDAYRGAPRSDLVDVVRDLSSYRGVEVRARALAAWAALGGSDSLSAIKQATEDIDPLVRRLAVALAALYPSAPADELVATMLRDDPELAAELAAGSAAEDEPVIVPEDPQ